VSLRLCRCCIFHSPYTLPVPYPVSPLLATLMRILHPGRFYGTKTAGVCTNNSHSGIRRVPARECASGPLPFPRLCILFIRVRRLGSATGGQRLPAQAWPTKTAAEPTTRNRRGPAFCPIPLSTPTTRPSASTIFGSPCSAFFSAWRCRCLCASTWLGRECISRSSPASGSSPDRFAVLTTLHGSLMVFLVLTAAPQAGFGNYFLPLQIGAREMAFPTLNLIALLATGASLLGLTTTFLIPSHPAITLWIVSVAILCTASLLNALNFSVTTIDLRAPGMTLPRLPLTVWAWFHQRPSLAC